MGYGIKNVVSGFNRKLTEEEVIPFTLARTYREHELLRMVLSYHLGQKRVMKSAEIGCGYGRNLQVLKEFSQEVHGFERDEQLAKLARELNPNCQVHNFGELPYKLGYEVILTFTFLQHLTADEFYGYIDEMQYLASKNSLLVFVEEDDTSLHDGSTVGRCLEEYEDVLRPAGFNIVQKLTRTAGPTYPKNNNGSCMVFKRGNI